MKEADRVRITVTGVGFVDHINAVPPSMTTRKAAGLMIEPESETAHTIKLSDRSIEARQIIVTREPSWESTLDASVSVRHHARGLQGKNLI